jgi:hypothetical protein
MRVGMRCRLSPTPDVPSHTSGAAMGAMSRHHSITSSVVASSVDRVGELSGVLSTSGGQDQEHRCAARIRGLRLIGFLRAPLHPEELPRDHVAYFRLNTCVHHACRSSGFPTKAHANVPRAMRDFGVTRRSGGVVCRHADDLDAIVESDTCDHLRQLICAFEPPPGF